MTTIEELLGTLDKKTARKVSFCMIRAMFKNPDLWTAKDRDEEQLAEIKKFIEKIEKKS